MSNINDIIQDFKKSSESLQEASNYLSKNVYNEIQTSSNFLKKIKENIDKNIELISNVRNKNIDDYNNILKEINEGLKNMSKDLNKLITITEPKIDGYYRNPYRKSYDGNTYINRSYNRNKYNNKLYSPRKYKN